MVTIHSVNPRLLRLPGPSLLQSRALQLEEEIREGKVKCFPSVIRADVEDPQAIGQQPLSVLRQVLSGCANPNGEKLPSDVEARCKNILEDCGGRRAGAYSYSEGVGVIRCHVADFISARDSYDADPHNVILVSGASDGLRVLFNLLNHANNGMPPGVLVPVPHSPFYQTILAELGIHKVPYYLSEKESWVVGESHLRDAVTMAKRECVPRALIVSNPGNPTGAVFSIDQMDIFIKVATEEKLLLIADEEFQSMVYSPATFHSFRRRVLESDPPYSCLEVASLMSVSTGIAGESGLRGGYIDLLNFTPDVIAILLKSICIKMCPSVLGQAALDVIVKPPVEGEESYPIYHQEHSEWMTSLKLKAEYISRELSRIPRMRCFPIKGGIFAFPSLLLPLEAMDPEGPTDNSYVQELLENTGLCVVPGSQFGQIPGTYHFRMSILLPLQQLEEAIERLKIFQLNLINSYK